MPTVKLPVGAPLPGVAKLQTGGPVIKALLMIVQAVSANENPVPVTVTGIPV